MSQPLSSGSLEYSAPLASAIRRLRKRPRLSPEDFAAALGFKGANARVTVWRWETGKRKPSAQTVALMKMLQKGKA